MRWAAVLAAALVLATPAAGAPAPVTFATAGQAALSTLVTTWYAGGGDWNECNAPGCAQTDSDWGADSLTYALWLRYSTAGDATIPPVLAALAANATTYPAPCQSASGCQSWSDQPVWDAIAEAREYEVSKDPATLAKAEAAYQFVAGSSAYSLGGCPDIPYQQPGGGSNDLKTLETGANELKAAILLYQATGDHAYLDAAKTLYTSIRARFLDPAVPLYSVYAFDDGQTCTQLPHRFFASVNGDMIWSGVELAQATGDGTYLGQAAASAQAVATDLSDPAGIFVDLQAENDVAEPLVEAMYVLAVQGQAFARTWILRNAAAALSARAADGSYGRFFDGPPPATTVTAWQTNGGLALEIAAAALDPSGSSVPGAWAGARRVIRQLGTPGTIRFRGSAIALIGTLGEACCEPGHARVFVDGRETFDQTGIWQNKSSSGHAIRGTVLFAWRWPHPGLHTISFAPGTPNGKEGGSFLHVRAYLIRA